MYSDPTGHNWLSSTITAITSVVSVVAKIIGISSNSHSSSSGDSSSNKSKNSSGGSSSNKSKNGSGGFLSNIVNTISNLIFGNSQSSGNIHIQNPLPASLLFKPTGNLNSNAVSLYQLFASTDLSFMAYQGTGNAQTLNLNRLIACSDPDFGLYDTKKDQVILALTTAYNSADYDDKILILTLEYNVKNDYVDISNIKTTVINGETYLDYSEAANTMLIDHATETQKHAWTINDLNWFNSMVKGGAPWDIKLQKNWGPAMSNTLYLGTSGTFAVYGQPMSADDLGNLHYGYVGKALGYGIDFFSKAAGAANIRDNQGVSLPVAMAKALEAGPPGYGDKSGDNDWIRQGYAWATNSGW
jgi:hypothetical protein